MVRSFWLILSMVLIFSCQKEEYGFTPTFIGDGNAVKNGEYWTGKIFGKRYNDSIFSFSIEHRTNQGYARGSISFDAIPFMEDWINLSESPYDSVNIRYGIDSIPSVKYSTRLGDGHVAGDIFKLMEDREDNYFKIYTIDEQKVRITGIFNLGFEFDSLRNLGVKSDPSEPDTIIFKDGYFELELPK